MVRTPPFQGENPGSNPSGAAKITKSPFGDFFILLKSPTRIGQSTAGAHDQYADEQLANLQKRICLIEFLRLGLIIVCQGAVGLPK